MYYPIYHRLPSVYSKYIFNNNIFNITYYMPFVIKKVEDKFKLYNKDKKRFVNKTFNTRKSAMAAKKNYENYDKRNNKGNKYK